MNIIKSTDDGRTVYTLNGDELVSAEIVKEDNENVIKISGAIKTVAAPCFSEIIFDAMKTKENFTLDFSGVTYIASAGLRVLLNMQQCIDDGEAPDVRIINVTNLVMEVFESTGFAGLLNIIKS